MEMVTAVPVNVTAQLILSMHKIAHIMDVSRWRFFLFSNEITIYSIHLTKKVRGEFFNLLRNQLQLLCR